MAHTFETFNSPDQGRVRSVAEEIDAAQIAGPASDIVSSPRESDQTQVNRLSFVGFAILGIMVIAAISLVF